MRHLNTIEVAKVSGGFSLTPAKGAAIGAIGGLAVVGAQKIAIDALKPICSSIVDVNSFSVFVGSAFGTPEHVTHMITSAIGFAAVAGLVHCVAQD
ncbi:MAG: hypothetical protein HYX61_07185 [Gammaproteobacteria bacterium]|jgi:hypothetical protein|nr:hypothetical protein [Gammaproteobacteria bacterium]